MAAPTTSTPPPAALLPSCPAAQLLQRSQQSKRNATRGSLLLLVKMRKVQEMSNNFSNDINPFHVYDKRRRGQRGAAAGGAAGKGDGKHCEICMCHSCSRKPRHPAPLYTLSSPLLCHPHFVCSCPPCASPCAHVHVCVCAWGGVAGFTLGSTLLCCSVF